jgi:uncharacterized membrane-anchored protein YhcB (DUF1043 family)
MSTNAQMIVLTLVVMIVIYVIAFKLLKQQYQQFWNALPSLEEAQQMIAEKYPEHAMCFTLTKKVTETIHREWGARAYFYGDFLECKELGVVIRIRLGEKMS